MYFFYIPACALDICVSSWSPDANPRWHFAQKNSFWAWTNRMWLINLKCTQGYKFCYTFGKIKAARMFSCNMTGLNIGKKESQMQLHWPDKKTIYSRLCDRSVPSFKSETGLQIIQHCDGEKYISSHIFSTSPVINCLEARHTNTLPREKYWNWLSAFFY